MRCAAILSFLVLVSGCVIDAEYSDEPLILDPSIDNTQSGEPVAAIEPSSTATPEPIDPLEPLDPAESTTAAEPNINSGGDANPSGCNLEMSWARTASNIFAHSTMSSGGLYALMPNHPVVIGSHVDRDNPFDDVPLVAYRLEDGAPVFHLDYEEMMGTHDENWYTRAAFEHDETGHHLVVRPVLDAPEFWRLRIEEGRYNHAVRFTPNGQSVVLVSCERDERPDDFVPSMGTTIRQFGALDGNLESSVSIPDYCANHFGHQLSIAAMSNDGRHMLLASNDRFWNSYDPNSMMRVDLHRESYQRIDFNPEAVAILDLKLTPDGTQLFGSAMDGQMHRWSFPALEPLAIFGDVGVFELGRRTYMPSDESPIAFSKSGRYIAYIGADLDVVVARVSDNQIMHRIELTRFLNDDIMPNGNSGAEAAQLVFTEDGAGLVLGLTSGLAVYRCSGASFPEGRDNLSVLIDGPRFAEVGETVELTATHLDATHMHGHAFYVDGELISPPSTSRHVQWTPQSAGVYEITVRLIDGVNTGEATLFIDVVEP